MRRRADHFPLQQNLRLDAQFSGETFKPNEKQSHIFGLKWSRQRGRNRSGRVILIRIEERARTDEQFGIILVVFTALGSKSFGGITLKI